jgi:hypothetical protein
MNILRESTENPNDKRRPFAIRIRAVLNMREIKLYGYWKAYKVMTG